LNTKIHINDKAEFNDKHTPVIQLASVVVMQIHHGQGSLAANSFRHISVKILGILYTQQGY